MIILDAFRKCFTLEFLSLDCRIALREKYDESQKLLNEESQKSKEEMPLSLDFMVACILNLAFYAERDYFKFACSWDKFFSRCCSYFLG